MLSSRKQTSRVSNGEAGAASMTAAAPCLDNKKPHSDRKALPKTRCRAHPTLAGDLLPRRDGRADLGDGATQLGVPDQQGAHAACRSPSPATVPDRSAVLRRYEK